MDGRTSQRVASFNKYSINQQFLSEQIGWEDVVIITATT